MCQLVPKPHTQHYSATKDVSADKRISPAISSQMLKLDIKIKVGEGAGEGASVGGACWGEGVCGRGPLSNTGIRVAWERSQQERSALVGIQEAGLHSHCPLCVDRADTALSLPQRSRQKRCQLP